MRTEPLSEKVAVAFVQPLYELNIGYIARCMKNFGLSKLYLISPRCRVGVEAIKYSTHAREIVESAVTVRSLEDLLPGFDLVVGTTGKRGPEPRRRAITPWEAASRIVNYSGKVLVVLGREDIGLTNRELEMCDIVVTIPANPAFPILNVSHAAAILFYEIYKASTLPHEIRGELPRREETEVLLQYFNLLLSELGVPEHRRRRACLTLRRIVGSYGLTASDVRMLVGAIRGAVEKIKALEAGRKER